MSGMSDRNQLVDFVLGYDDSYVSNEASRSNYRRAFNGPFPHCAARPEHMMQLRGYTVVLRPSGNEGEYLVQKIVEATLKRMTKLEKK
jgi:hypothetical protein